MENITFRSVEFDAATATDMLISDRDLGGSHCWMDYDDEEQPELFVGMALDEDAIVIYICEKENLKYSLSAKAGVFNFTPIGQLGEPETINLMSVRFEVDGVLQEVYGSHLVRGGIKPHIFAVSGDGDDWWVYYIESQH